MSSYPIQHEFLFSYPFDSHFSMTPSSIKNIRQLSNFLRCDESFLSAYLDGDFLILDRTNFTNLSKKTDYTSIIEKLYIPKKNKRTRSYREIYSIRTDTLKDTLKGLNTFLQDAFTPSFAVHGYVQGKNIRTNAEAHLAKRLLLSVDIHKFFENISAATVEQALGGIGFSSFASKRLSFLVTLNDFLPPGFNTSPTISNIVVKEMDEQLIKIGGTKCTYTRYADDLYFSSNIQLPSIEDIEKTITYNGFSLNPDKTKYMLRGSKQYVTGLTVFDHVRPHVTRKIKRNLRLELYYMKKHGLLEHVLHTLGYTIDEYVSDPAIRSEVNDNLNAFSSRIEGWIHFMKSVERPAALKLEAIYKGNS